MFSLSLHQLLYEHFLRTFGCTVSLVHLATLNQMGCILLAMASRYRKLHLAVALHYFLVLAKATNVPPSCALRSCLLDVLHVLAAL